MNSSKFFSEPVKFLLMLALAALVGGCGGGSGGGGGGSSAGTSTLSVSLTDAPGCGVEAVYVTVSKIRVHQSGGASENDRGWSEIALQPPRRINLLDLTNGVLEPLGQTTLPAGHYTQIRLVLDPNAGSVLANSVVVSGDEIELDTPSAMQSGIKLIHEFDMVAGQQVDLVLDFDACKSIVKRGKGRKAGKPGFNLKPVIKVIPAELNGIRGVVDQSLRGSNVAVSAQIGGSVVRSTIPDATTGAFLLARLDPGTYDVVITADGHATAVIAAVPVADNASVTEISTSAAPVILPNSTTGFIRGTASLDPPSATESALLTARQTFSGGPIVTVKSQSADPDTGAYELNLPVDAPVLGGYEVGGTLPIPLNPQPALAGLYNLEASATGYETKSIDKDISQADVVQDVILGLI